MSIRGRESHARFGEAVNMWRVEIGRPVTSGVKRALVIGKKDDDVGFFRGSDETVGGDKNQ
jgi:hypothetical protein